MNGSVSQSTPTSLPNLAVGSVVSLLDRSGFFKLRFQHRRGLRIVCYHGVCDDEAVGEPWVPSYFVSAGMFARHLEIMKRYGPVVCLADVIEQWRAGEWPEQSCTAITFDDVAACSFVHARRVLDDHKVRASFFVSTGNVTSGRLFNADVIGLSKLHPHLHAGNEDEVLAALLEDPAKHKQMPLEQLESVLGDLESGLRQSVDQRIVETLRPMNWREIRLLASEGHEIGGHTVDHSILGHQTRETRDAQIVECLHAIEQETGCKAHGFAYPNGGPGDFESIDQECLREHGVRYAVTTKPGFAVGGAGADAYAIPRVCVGMGHTAEKFAMELSGVMDKRRLRQYGWR